MPELTKTFALPKRFSIAAPEYGRAELDHSDNSLALHFSPGAEPIYILRYDLQRGVRIQDEAQRFFQQGIRGACPNLIGYDFDEGTVNDTFYVQVVAKITNEHWWLARLVTRNGLPGYYLLHTNGSVAHITESLRSLTEFYINED